MTMWDIRFSLFVVFAAIAYSGILYWAIRGEKGKAQWTIASRDEVSVKGIVSRSLVLYDAETDQTLGRIRYHFDELAGECETVVVMGVGASMTVNNYEELSTAVVAGKGEIFIVVDHAPGSVAKSSPEKFAKLFNHFVRSFHEIISICKIQDSPRVLIGGHSSSGEAVVSSMQQSLLAIEPRGLVLLDPYDLASSRINHSVKIEVNSIFWGFEKSSCLVDKKRSVIPGYGLTTTNSRVLYLVNNACEGGAHHCDFTDSGCGGMGPMKVCAKVSGSEWLVVAVASSIHRAIQVDGGKFTKENFRIPNITDTGRVFLLAKEDEVSNRENFVDYGCGS